MKEHTNNEPEASEIPKEAFVYLVKNPCSNEISACAWNEPLASGTRVLSPTRYGLDLGVVLGSASELGGASYEPGNTCCCAPEAENNDDASMASHRCGCKQIKKVQVEGDLDWISRIATEEDLARYKENFDRADEAVILCRDKIMRHGLSMKLVNAHYLLGEQKLLFFFTAESRVDFRELVKDLVSVFRMRIELRQIGVRDESRVLGGLAVCGRDFCCHSVTDKINPVSIKMAKEQNLSLNSMKISGPCSRLLCCLAYEYDFYVEEKLQFPPEGSRLKVQHDLMKVTEVNILTKKMTLIGSEGRMLTLPCSLAVYHTEHGRWEIIKEKLEEFLATSS